MFLTQLSYELLIEEFCVAVIIVCVCVCSRERSTAVTGVGCVLHFDDRLTAMRTENREKDSEMTNEKVSYRDKRWDSARENGITYQGWANSLV